MVFFISRIGNRDVEVLAKLYRFWGHRTKGTV